MATQYQQLDEIAKGIRILNKTLCCQGTSSGGSGTFDGTIISSCLDPVHTSLCEWPALLVKLNELQDHIDDISVTVENVNIDADTINLDTQPLEDLITASNVVLADILTEVERGAACGTPQFVEVCNQIDVTAMTNLLGNILT